MTPAVFAIVLSAAVVHATWNAIVKRASDKLLTTVLVAVSAALLAALILPFVPQPAVASWPFIPASALLQVLFFVLLSRTYHVADMSQSYPLMRGTAPLLVALVSRPLFGDSLPAGVWIGVGIICLGILSMAARRRHGDGRGMLLALATAMVIAGYTLLDGVGVRRSGAPAAYAFWEYVLTGLPFIAWALLAQRRTFGAYLRENWHFGLVGGACTLVSYGTALWAMTVAPVAVVAALRETSILFGVAVSGLVLKEHVGAARITAACLIAVGALVLRLA